MNYTVCCFLFHISQFIRESIWITKLLFLSSSIGIPNTILIWYLFRYTFVWFSISNCLKKNRNLFCYLKFTNCVVCAVRLAHCTISNCKRDRCESFDPTRWKNAQNKASIWECIRSFEVRTYVFYFAVLSRQTHFQFISDCHSVWFTWNWKT